MTKKLYRESFNSKEVCSHGCSHQVYYHEVVEVVVLDDHKTSVDYGGTMVPSTAVWYADKEGMIYFSRAEWDGPSWPVDELGNVWMPRPIGEVKKDLLGNII